MRYTRAVTLAWPLFFLLNVAASFLLFEFTPLRVWSIFVNFCALPLILLMFVVEYAVRRRVLPQVQRSGLVATLRVYFADSPPKWTELIALLSHTSPTAIVAYRAGLAVTVQQFLDEARQVARETAQGQITC